MVKVVDFGIAKLGPSLSESFSTTHTGDLVGTPVYMAPEQVFGEADVDGRADVWALGILLYEALAGALPTAAATLGQVLEAITRDPIAPLALAAPARESAWRRSSCASAPWGAKRGGAPAIGLCPGSRRPYARGLHAVERPQREPVLA